MASSFTPLFQLNSTQTALAFLLPPHLQHEINSLRKIHDKAYSKWQPHVNILYPFVDPSFLQPALSTLREILQSDKVGPIELNTSEVGVFTHRRNATVFLKPSEEAEKAVCELRRVLVGAIDCEVSDGTRDGNFRPHLSVGQAGLNSNAVERLMEQARKLATVSWTGTSLVVLRRQPSGEMKVMEELRIGGVEDSEPETLPIHMESVWKPCFHFDSEQNWTVSPLQSRRPPTAASSEIQILTYNLMAEPLAPSLVSRLPLIIEAIKSATSSSSLRVLNLQEVDDESLPLILGHPYISASFPFSTHAPSTLLPSRRNLVTVASGTFWYHLLAFTERHKSALIVSFDSLNVDIANVHLTSSLSDQALNSKANQMNILADFMATKENATKTSLVTGDFNLTSSSRTIEVALAKGIISPETIKLMETVLKPDIWEDVFNLSSFIFSNFYEAEFDGEEGATFDRLRNPWAALTDSPIVNRPERYDRLLVQKGKPIKLLHFEVIGSPTELADCGSDHYGLSIVLQINQQFENQYNSDQNLTGVSCSDLERIEVVEDITDVQPLLSPFLPTERDRKERQQAIKLLENTLKSTERTANIIFAPLGSYLMDTYFPESDVDLLAIGSVSVQIFFDFAASKLKHLNTSGINDFKGVHLVNSLVSIVEVWVSGIKFDLQYCEAPQLVNRFHTMPNKNLNSLVLDETLISALPLSSLRPLNTYRDTAYLLDSISDIPSYRAAHRYLSLYLKRRGLYSARFGYLGGIHLSLMLNRVTKLMSMAFQDPTYRTRISVATLVRTFLFYYASFDWARDNVTDPMLPNHQNVSRTLRDAVLIESIHVPTARKNVASSCTQLTAQTLTREFKLACEKLKLGDWGWCLRLKADVVKDFFNDFGAFIMVEINVWDLDGPLGVNVREVVGSLESKFPRFLVSLGRISGLDARIWPEQLCDEKHRKPEERIGREVDLKGFYLIGVSACDEQSDPQRKKLFSGKVIAAMRDFETNIKENKEIQRENAWISLNLVPRKKVIGMNLIIDERDWGSQEKESHAQEMKEEQLFNNFNFSSMSTTKKSHQRPARSFLRPAQDIMSRITWDPALETRDFLIGYEDRFIGVKEIELGRWKHEQTDEEFIPMHRIVWVRRRDAAGGEKVWDRKEKLDLIFGSGT